MYELDIDRNALEQLQQGVIPWTVLVPSGLDPLPYFTSRHIGRAIHGYTLSETGVWHAARLSAPHAFQRTHLIHTTGRFPQLDSDFQANLDLLRQEITRSPENGLQGVEISYDTRCDAWYRGITAFPRLYPTVLRRIYGA